MEDGNNKILKLESYWLEAQALCKSVNEQLSETQTQYETLDKKYNKAKKLLKDYQQKWVWDRRRGWDKGLYSVKLANMQGIFYMQQVYSRISSNAVVQYCFYCIE